MITKPDVAPQRLLIVSLEFAPRQSLSSPSHRRWSSFSSSSSALDGQPSISDIPRAVFGKGITSRIESYAIKHPIRGPAGQALSEVRRFRLLTRACSSLKLKTVQLSGIRSPALTGLASLVTQGYTAKLLLLK
jgi:hypothetical protein